MAEFDPIMFLGASLLFSVVAIGMLFAPLLIGKFLRPNNLDEENKGEIYECGEPTIGTSNVQFDLRFYVVALLFIVFDVEVAFFFPWAVVFGQTSMLANHNLTETQRLGLSQQLTGQVDAGVVSVDAAQQFLQIGFLDVLVFFGVVLVGFAYIWSRGDLDWVRSVAKQRALAWTPPPPAPLPTSTPSAPASPASA